jgi:hypothetical protein
MDFKKLADSLLVWIGFALFGMFCAAGIVGYGVYYLFSHVTVVVQ